MGRYRSGDIYGVAFPIVSNLAGSFLLGRLCLSDLYNDKNAKGKLCVRHKGDNCRIKISRCWAMPLLCQDSTDISVQHNFMELETWIAGLATGLACCFCLSGTSKEVYCYRVRYFCIRNASICIIKSGHF